MSRSRRVPRLALLAAATAAAGCLPAPEPTLAPDPSRLRNLVVVSFDALRADALSVYGGDVPTPAFAALAGQSLVFDDAMAAAQATPTAFAALWTGQLPHRVFRGWRFDPPVTLAEAFAAHGFETIAVVNNAQLAPQRGFDRGFSSYRFWSEAEEGDEEALAVAIELVAARRPADRPLFLWVHLLDPHAPYDVDAEFAAAGGYRTPQEGRFARSSGGGAFAASDPEELARLADLYRGEVARADRRLGRFVAALDGSALAGSTALAVTADHGEAFAEHGELQHVTVHREIRWIPLLIRAPGLEPGRTARPVSHVDLAPTFARWFGLANAPRIDGVEIARLPPDRERFALAMTSADRAAAAVIDDASTYVLDCARGPAAELYDRRGDPGETRNLAPSRPQSALALGEILAGVLGEDPCEELVQAQVGRAPTADDAETAGLSPEHVAELRALGYIGGGDGGTRLEIGPLLGCDAAGLGRALVRWRAAGGVRVLVGEPGRLFASADGDGEEATGPWAREGLAVELVDTATGRTLARRRIGACQG